MLEPPRIINPGEGKGINWGASPGCESSIHLTLRMSKQLFLSNVWFGDIGVIQQLSHFPHQQQADTYMEKSQENKKSHKYTITIC